jgi:hypothetical protein
MFENDGMPPAQVSGRHTVVDVVVLKRLKTPAGQ